MNAYAAVVFRQRRRYERDCESIGNLAHRLGQRFRIMDNDRHCADDVRRANRLIGRKRRQQKNVVSIVEQDVAHQVVGDNGTHGPVGFTTSNESAVKRLYDIGNVHDAKIIPYLVE